MTVTVQASEIVQRPTRAIIPLGIAAFATQAMVRAPDSLLPQIAADFGTTVGIASIVVTAYAISHGTVQLFVGPFGDRLGKYATVTGACALCSLIVLCCGLPQTLRQLAVARMASGAVAAWIIPLAVAFVGDVVPYADRQRVLGRFMSGQILGQIFGQSVAGIIGQFFGWRMVFFMLAGLFALATLSLLRELAVNPLTRVRAVKLGWRGLGADYVLVATDAWARTVLIAVFFTGALMFGPFAFVAADLHQRFGLGFALIGIIIAMFAVGGLLYSALVKQLLDRFGERGIALIGALMLAAAYLALAVEPTWLMAPPAVIGIGLGFYMIMATLQTNATQMVPQARGTAVSMFASSFYLGQTAGVAVAALLVSRYGAPAMFAIAASLLVVLAFWLVRRQRQR
jgi:MFS transporter, YNFM family, putative membrane transport protein